MLQINPKSPWDYFLLRWFHVKQIAPQGKHTLLWQSHTHTHTYSHVFFLFFIAMEGSWQGVSQLELGALLHIGGRKDADVIAQGAQPPAVVLFGMHLDDVAGTQFQLVVELRGVAIQCLAASQYRNGSVLLALLQFLRILIEMLRLHLAIDGWVLQQRLLLLLLRLQRLRLLLRLLRLVVLVLRAELIEIRVLLIGSTIRLAAIAVMIMMMMMVLLVIVMAILQIGQGFGLNGRGNRGICRRDYLWLAGEIGLDVALASVKRLHHRTDICAGAVAIIVAMATAVQVGAVLVGKLILVVSGYVGDVVGQHTGRLLRLRLVVVLQPVGHLQDALLQTSAVTGDLWIKQRHLKPLKSLKLSNNNPHECAGPVGEWLWAYGPAPRGQSAA